MFIFLLLLVFIYIDFFLEKLCIDDGKFIHKYISRPEETQSKLNNSLPYLPETNTEEYVRNWCSTHITLQDDTKTISKPTALDDCDSIGSSLHESLEADPKTSEFENVTYRRNRFQREPNSVSVSRKLSRESGILTLPDSTLDYVYEMDNLEKVEVSEMCNESSDYFTCSFASPNAFERKTGEKDMEVQNGFIEKINLNEAGIGDGLCVDNSTSTECSFVTVSEWYRYTDEEEGVMLFEKRLLKSTSR